jgi:hypothetical protein
MLTPEEREAVIKRVLGDSVVQAMDALRAETRRFVWWPWSRRRLDRMFDALEDVMATQVNRVQGSTGQVLETFDRRIADLERKGGSDGIG